MKVLIVGSGGREHAIAWKLKTQNPDVKLFTAPGNPGTAGLGRNIPLNVDTEEGLYVLSLVAKALAIDLTVVGPEVPLALGITDTFEREGLKVFGPTQRAAQVEASKVFAKALMVRKGIPTAKVYGIFPNFESLSTWLKDREINPPHFPMVLKASGLAYGKGVRVCRSLEEALQFARVILINKRFGDIAPVMVEECLTGPELSLLAFTDGEHVVPMLPARDYKPIFNGNRGPNTGGMGSYAPVTEISAGDIQTITNRILIPAVRGLAEMGRLYKGVLYTGLMLTAEGPKVLEFNCRFGDPEAQPLLMLLKSNLLELLVSCANGDLKEEALRWETGAAVCVVAASKGYPGSYPKGKPIVGTDLVKDDNVTIFQAGTAIDNGVLVTSGGRVLGVTARGEDLWEARGRAYTALSYISFDGMQYRTDIGLGSNLTEKDPPRKNPPGSNSKTRKVRESAGEGAENDP